MINSVVKGVYALRDDYQESSDFSKRNSLNVSLGKKTFDTSGALVESFEKVLHLKSFFFDMRFTGTVLYIPLHFYIKFLNHRSSIQLSLRNKPLYDGKKNIELAERLTIMKTQY